MDNRKIVAAALVLSVGALAGTSAQAQVQMDQRCVRAIESEVRGRFPEAQRVETTAVTDRQLSDVETGFSGAGRFDDRAGNRTTFSFDCISSARTGQAYGVTVSNAIPQARPASAASQASSRPRGPLGALIAAIVGRGPQGSAPAAVNAVEAPVVASKATARRPEPVAAESPGAMPPLAASAAAELPVDAASPAAASPVEVSPVAAAFAIVAATRVGAASVVEASPVGVASQVEASSPVEVASPRILDMTTVESDRAVDDCTTRAEAETGCSPASAPATGEVLSEPTPTTEVQSPPRSTLPRADAALSRIAEDLPAGQVAVLRFAAHATTAGSMCPNIELNNPAIVATLSNVVYATSFGLPPQQAASRRDAALIAYGVLTGLMLQEAAADRTAFCADAARNAGEPASWSFIRLRNER